jgi:hypothetical protein
MAGTNSSSVKLADLKRLVVLVSAKSEPAAIRKIWKRLTNALPIDVLCSLFPSPDGTYRMSLLMSVDALRRLRHQAVTEGKTSEGCLRDAVALALARDRSTHRARLKCHRSEGTDPLWLTELELARGRLLIRRKTGLHIVFLDEVAESLLDTWLRHRHRRWTATGHPPPFISQQTKADLSPVTPLYVELLFKALRVPASKIRQDRSLDTARHTADPVYLMQVFGISGTTALTYAQAAHPDRGSVIPR